MRNFILIAVLFSGTPALAQTALDRYIAKPEPDFSWQEYAVDHKLVADTYFIKLVSQRWRSAAEVDRSIWEHELIVIVPNFLLCNSDHRETALLMIAGGRNPDPGEFTTEIDATAGVIATSLCTVVAVIKQVPNQPLQFADEFKRPRREDAILAYSLNKYLETGDEEWPVHLAMTKAAVKAMDAVQAFSRTHGSVPNIDDFIVLGGSKRGWTTWLAAAVDARVKAVVPISIDLLNLDEQFQHHWEAYGFYTPSVRDYEEYDIACRMQTPRGQQLLGIIDPLSYRERYTMPKLIINSAGDQFFVSDSWRFYYDDLPEPKRLRYTPNTSHSQGDLEDVIGLFRSTIPWLKDVRANREAPRFDWRVEADGSIRVQTIDPPEHVRLWQAHNPTHRDFRLEAIGPAWHANDLQDRGGGVYVGFVAPPAQGFSAYFVELEFPNSSFPASNPLFTTGVVVTPDVLPFAGTACRDFPSYTNLWWSPSLPGQAVQILQQGNSIGAAWYAYGATGQDAWVNWIGALNGASGAGPLLRFSGPALGMPWDNATVQSQAVGSATINFRSTRSATFRYQLDGVNSSLELVPFDRLADQDYTGIWYDPSRSGQGVQLVRHGQQLSGGWYHYGTDGVPRWLTFVGALQGTTARADLLRFSGPALGERWDEDLLQSAKVGEVEVELRGPAAVAFRYRVDGVSGSLDLVPFTALP